MRQRKKMIFFEKNCDGRMGPRQDWKGCAARQRGCPNKFALRWLSLSKPPHLVCSHFDELNERYTHYF